LDERRLLSVFTVTNTLDDGSTGSLRWAVTQVNADTSDTGTNPDLIQFDIPPGDPGYSAGIWTIAPLSPLPTISNPAIVDGYTQAGAQPNTNGPTQGDNAHLTIEVSGSKQFPYDTDGLTLEWADITLRGLIVDRFFSGRGGTGISIPYRGLDVIEGCFIGTDNNSTAGIGNGSGVNVGGSSNTIGGTTAAARNVISGNGYTGIYLDGKDNVVEGNLLGTDLAGAAPLANPGQGIALGGSDNTIGGTTANARNIIAGAGSSNGAISGGGSADVIEGNFIGTDVTGTAKIFSGTPSIPDESIGIAVSGGDPQIVHPTTIGGTIAGAGNLISGNGAAGVRTLGNLVIEGNLIGTDVTGRTALGNGIGVELSRSEIQDGVLGGNASTVGGTTATARNVISGNDTDGVFDSCTIPRSEFFAAHDLIEGNFIGTDATGLAALPNQTGAVLDGTRDCTIGGTAQGAGNLIAGNRGAGVRITATVQNSSASGNRVVGNLIGTDLTGLHALGNGASGVILGQDPSLPMLGEVVYNTVGGTAAGAGNVVAFNSAAGVTVASDNAKRNAIESNTIFENATLGIDLGGTGVPLPFTPGGPHVGPNDDLNAPHLISISYVAGKTQITGTLSNTPNKPFRIEFYGNPVPSPSRFVQGRTLLGAINVTTNSQGVVAPFTFITPGALTHQSITATATGLGANTSEFSQAIETPAHVPSTPSSGSSGNAGGSSQGVKTPPPRTSPAPSPPKPATTSGSGTGGNAPTLDGQGSHATHAARPRRPIVHVQHRPRPPRRPARPATEAFLHGRKPDSRRTRPGT
jgi:hypothetical protein